MAKHTEYLEAKRALKEFASDIKRDLKGDNPAIRQCINDYLDSIFRESWYCNIGSHKTRDRYYDWLSSYACTLHPKD